MVQLHVVLEQQELPTQPMAWNVTTAGERTIFPKFAEAAPSPTKKHQKVHSAAHAESDTSEDFFIGMVHCTTTKISRLEGTHSCKPPKNLFQNLAAVCSVTLFTKDDITNSVQYHYNSHMQDLLH